MGDDDKIGETVERLLAGYRALNDAQAQLIERLASRNAELMRDQREMIAALRDLMVAQTGSTQEARMRQLEYERSTGARTRVLQLLPALVNGITGRNVFPSSSSDEALIEALAQNIDEDEIDLFTQTVGARSPELAALLAHRFREIRARRQTDLGELRDLAREARGATAFEGPLGPREAVGEPVGDPPHSAPGRNPIDDPPRPGKKMALKGQVDSAVCQGVVYPAGTHVTLIEPFDRFDPNLEAWFVGLHPSDDRAAATAYDVFVAKLDDLVDLEA